MVVENARWKCLVNPEYLNNKKEDGSSILLYISLHREIPESIHLHKASELA